GMKNREIAELLNVSEHTVKNHLFRIFERLGISSRAELILYLHGQRSSADSNPSDCHSGVVLVPIRMAHMSPRIATTMTFSGLVGYIDSMHFKLSTYCKPLRDNLTLALVRINTRNWPVGAPSLRLPRPSRRDSQIGIERVLAFNQVSHSDCM